MSESPNVGLYSGNVIIEFNTDQKCCKPVVKANEKATPEEISQAVKNAGYALNQATFELYNLGYTIPDALKGHIKQTQEDIEEQRKLEEQYKDNEEILNTKDGGVESHSSS